MSFLSSRSISHISSSSPRNLRRLRSTPRRVQWSTSNNNTKDSTPNNESTSSQQRQVTTENNEVFTGTTEYNDDEMTPSGMIDSLSLDHTQTNNNTTDKTIIICNSPSISSTDDEKEESNNITGLSSTNVTNRKPSKRAEILSLFDEWKNGEGYTCKICSTVGIILIITSNSQV